MRQRGDIEAGSEGVRPLVSFYWFILVVWGFYRVLFRLPVWVEELLVKPGVFLGPLWWKLKNEGGDWGQRLRSIGVGSKNLFAAVAYGLALGVVYLLVGRLGELLRFGVMRNPYGTPLNNPGLAVGLALATAVSEQLVFCGWLLPRLLRVWKDEWKSVMITAALFAGIHLPLLVVVYRAPAGLVVSQFVLSFVLGLGNGVLMVRLKNVAAPVASQALWILAVELFR